MELARQGQEGQGLRNALEQRGPLLWKMTLGSETRDADCRKHIVVLHSG
jgi:hypothetical protein